MRAWCLACLLATAASAGEGDGAAGKGEDRHAALVKQLGSAEASARAKAVRALGREGDERAVTAVRAVLDDPDARVRAAAAVTLARLDAHDDRVLDVLVTALRNPDWYTRWDACVAIGSLGPSAQSAAPALLAAASDKDLDIARDAVNAVLRVALLDPQVCAGLVLVLESDAPVDRRLLLRALYDAGQIALAKTWLASELIGNRHGLRPRAAALLAKCGVAGTDLLLDALRSEQPAARARAICWLDRDETIGASVFLDVLSDRGADMRQAAIRALSRRNAAGAAPDIAKLLADEEAPVRLSAAEALGKLGAAVPEAGPPLVRLLGEGDGLAEASLEAMRATGFAGLSALLEYRLERPPAPKDSVWVVRLHPEAAVEDRATKLDGLLSSLGDNRHGAALVAALRETLAEDEDQILVAALRSEDAAVRRAAAVLLGHLARDRFPAIRALRSATHDREADVRTAAGRAIEQLNAAPR